MKIPLLDTDSEYSHYHFTFINAIITIVWWSYLWLLLPFYNVLHIQFLRHKIHCGTPSCQFFFVDWYRSLPSSLPLPTIAPGWRQALASNLGPEAEALAGRPADPGKRGSRGTPDGIRAVTVMELIYDCYMTVVWLVIWLRYNCLISAM